VVKSGGSFLIGETRTVVAPEVRQRRIQLHVAACDQPTEQGAEERFTNGTDRQRDVLGADGDNRLPGPDDTQGSDPVGFHGVCYSMTHSTPGDMSTCHTNITST
jgi:hypothetical protein